MAACLSLAGLVLLLYGGFVLLALSQDQHRRAIGVAPMRVGVRAAQRIAGYAFLALALPLAIWRDGAGFGTLLWAVLLSVAACAVTFTLSWRPGWLASLAGRRCK